MIPRTMTMTVRNPHPWRDRWVYRRWTRRSRRASNCPER
jgi:hypothetical protein